MVDSVLIKLLYECRKHLIDHEYTPVGNRLVFNSEFPNGHDRIDLDVLKYLGPSDADHPLNSSRATYSAKRGGVKLYILHDVICQILLLLSFFFALRICSPFIWKLIVLQSCHSIVQIQHFWSERYVFRKTRAFIFGCFSSKGYIEMFGNGR